MSDSTNTPQDPAPESLVTGAEAPATSSLGALAESLANDVEVEVEGAAAPADGAAPEIPPAETQEKEPLPPIYTDRQYIRSDESRPVYKKVTGKVYLPGAIVLPGMTVKAAEEMTNRSRERTVDAAWLQAVTASAGNMADLSAEQALEQEGTDWRNSPVNSEGKAMGMTGVAVEAKTGEVTGEQALLGLRTALGMGSSANVPLYGSGIRLKIDDPGDLVLQEMLREQTTERGRIGRETFSTSFGSRMVFTIETIIKVIVANVRETTVKEGVNLLEHITITDFNSAVWGLASAVYNNGFEYHRPCTAAAHECNHVETEHLNLARAIYYDWSKLTKEQLAHMANRKAGVYSAEDLVKYRDQFTFQHGRDVVLKANNGLELGVTLQVPVIAEVIQSGHDWINYISKFVMDALGQSANPADRDVYMERVARTTAACQHRHWVKSLSFNGSIISKKADIDSAFRDTISASPELINQLEEEIAKFSVRCTPAVVGVPNFTCSVCNRKQMESKDGDPNAALVVPFDPVSVFFDLMFQRLGKYLLQE